MSDMLGKLKKRRCYPVDLGDGDQVHCRAMTIGELKDVDPLAKDLKTPFIMGRGIVNSDGSEQFPRKPDETPEQYANRMQTELADVSTETIAAISAAIGKIGKVPEADTLKN